MSRCALGLVVVSLAVASCGYVQNGTWTDDPRNFARAGGYAKPDDIEVVHSWYWRSAHFTREESYFFHIRGHDELLKRFVEANELKPVQRSESSTLPTEYCFTKPDWFTPQASDAYETWRCTGDRDCWLFRDRRSQDLFIYACQM